MSTATAQQTPDELILNNMGLVGSHAYRISQTTGVDYLELFQEGSIGLIKAARTFDPSKGFKFSTYAGRCIQNDMFVYLRRCQRISRRYQSLDAIPNGWELVGKWEPDMSYVEIDQAAFARMNTKQKQLLMLLFEGYSQAEAAIEMGHTASYISRILNKARSNYEDTSGFKII
jgi:RNA polymerase sporulation-specific sigma factor